MKLCLFVLCGLFVVSAVLSFARFVTAENNAEAEKARKYLKKVPVCVIAAIIALVVALSCTVVPSGKTGVLTHFGQINPNVLTNGIHWTIPFVDSVELVNNKQQDISNDYQVWSETATRTALYYSDVTVTVSIDSGESAWILANVDNYKTALVSGSLIDSAIKSSSKLLSDTDATNRAIIEPLVAETLQNSLDEKYGKRVVTIHKVTIGNVDFEDSYNQAIAEKQNAQLAYEKQAIENKTSVERAQADADAKLIAAQAEADAKLIAAQAEADAMKITAEAEAEANQTLLNSLSEIIIRYNTIEKWDGVLPTVMGQNDTILDIADLLNGGTE